MMMRPRCYGEEKPTWDDLDPDSGELWLWEECRRCWRLYDPSWCKDDTWWLPFNALCDPGYQAFEKEYKAKVKAQSKKCAEYLKENKVSEGNWYGFYGW
jgi:hypothetical protein